MEHKKTRICILGASGYTGSELIRLLARHPFAEIVALTANSKAGLNVCDIFPHLSFIDLPVMIKNEDVDWGQIDLVFCALPHGITQDVISALPKHLKVVDLSADFRLRNPDDYLKWYGHSHKALDLQKEFIYGLPEFYAEKIKHAQYVANTGCYVATSLLPLLPLVQSKIIDPNDIIIDAKSGTSGAGRVAKEETHFCEISEGFHAYSVGGHRHSGEIDQEVSAFAGVSVSPTFTPHLLPQNRGILSTIYTKCQQGQSVETVHEILKKYYENKCFVHVMPLGKVPQTRYVKGSNFCMIGVQKGRKDGQVIIVSVLDNLMKGASGQAVQNMNIMQGYPEQTGLEQLPLFP